jgi:serine/threonine protein kinase
MKDLASTNHPFFPLCHHFKEATNANDLEYIVMELLTGEDMASIRNRIRSKSPTGLVPVIIASYLVRQMLLCVQEMHNKGYIHRDVKPSNFVRRDNQTTKFCIIDFGLAKQVN